MTVDYSAFARQALVESLAARLERHFAHAETGIERSLVIGILGEWGSGKSTVLEALYQVFADRARAEPDNQPLTLPVRFNPWRFEAEAHLIVPLLKTAQAEVKHFVDAHESALAKGADFLRHSATRLGETAVVLATAAKLEVSVPGLFKAQIDPGAALEKERRYLKERKDAAAEADFDSLYFNVHRKLQEITGHTVASDRQLNLLFLVDDLDRCLPEKAVQVMESIKLFLDTEGCAFALALDEEVVERGVLHRYRDYLARPPDAPASRVAPPLTGAEYLEKIIQLPLRLPAPTPGQIREFLAGRYVALFAPEQERAETLEPEIGLQRAPHDEALMELFVRAIPPVPRKHVRAAELLSLTLELAQARGFDRLDRLTVARLVILQLFAPELYRFGRRQPGFLATMERWAGLADRRWEHGTFIAGRLERIDRALDGAREEGMVEVDMDEEGATERVATAVKTLEDVERPLLELIDQAVNNRSGFDPRRIVQPGKPSATGNIRAHFVLLDDRSRLAGKVAPGATAQPAADAEADIVDIESYLAQLLSDREDAWVNVLADGAVPEPAFERMLRQLAGKMDWQPLPPLRWLEQVLPVLTPGQRERLEAQHPMRDHLQQTMLDAQRHEPATRAVAGRVLAWLGDPRVGVGLRDGLPDIDLAWQQVDVPDGVAYRLNTRMWRRGPEDPAATGELVRDDRKGKLALPTRYLVARYPATWQQFQAFVESDTYRDEIWWQGLGADVRRREIKAAHWPIPNHPRETVNWFQAMAFCRWLTARYVATGRIEAGDVVRLPTEWEWQYAASGGDAAAFRFPWGREYRAGYANINETECENGPHDLERTTAVGAYPQGATQWGAPQILDLSGNVLEWCLSTVPTLSSEETGGAAASRAVRGGSWYLSAEFAATVARVSRSPRNRFAFQGFRVVCVPAHAAASGR